jgi:hypothetical protein
VMHLDRGAFSTNSAVCFNVAPVDVVADHVGHGRPSDNDASDLMA